MTRAINRQVRQKRHSIHREQAREVITVQIREVTPQQVTIASAEYGHPDQSGQRLSFPAPTTKLFYLG